MSTWTATTQRFRSVYGDRPLHLLTMCLSIALGGYVLSVITVPALWNGATWWQSIAVWFIGAAIIHDLVLFPLYALADLSLTSGIDALRRRAPATTPLVSPLNYIRCPALATGLVLLLFFPGILEQGSHTFTAATGLTQQPYLQRFLLLTAAFFAVSSLAYAVALARTHRRHSQAPPASTGPSSQRTSARPK